MPFLGVYSWSQYTMPGDLPEADVTGDTTPDAWIGKTFTFNGGAPTTISINDDDADFEDGYVETGTSQTLAQAITIDGTTYPVGSIVENEFSLIDGSGQEIYVVRINGENVGFTYATGEDPVAAEAFTPTQGLDGSPSDNPDGLSSSAEPYANVICFAQGTRLETPFGPTPVEDLQRGHLVTTVDRGDQPILWLGKSHICLIDAPENRRPVLISAGSLGRRLPKKDLIVSQQHRMVVRDHASSSDARSPERFAPAKGLTPLKGIRIMNGRSFISYHHVLLPQHSVITAEGVLTESFFPGPMAMATLSEIQREQIYAFFPGLRHDLQSGYGSLARPALSVQEAKQWARKQRAWSHHKGLKVTKVQKDTDISTALKPMQHIQTRTSAI